MATDRTRHRPRPQEILALCLFLPVAFLQWATLRLQRLLGGGRHDG